MNVCQYAIVRESQKIRSIADYRPDGWKTVLAWADDIHTRLVAPVVRHYPLRDFRVVAQYDCSEE